MTRSLLRSRPRGLAVLALGVWLSVVPDAAAQTLRASQHTDAVPVDLAASVAAAIAPGGVRAQLDAVTIDLWWVSGIAGGPPTMAATGAWQQVPQGALLGAMRLSAPFRDVRGRVMPAGVYTLRFGLQPANGDHLGVSPNREFVLASPAAVDRDAAPTGYDAAVDRSRQTIGTSHPAVLSIDPVEADAKAILDVRTNEAGHQFVIVSVPREGGAISFGLILVGRIEA